MKKESILVYYSELRARHTRVKAGVYVSKP